MSWAKIDDKFFSHPKVRRAGKDAVLLYLAGLTYCNEHLTEGFISEDSLPLIGFFAFVDDFKQSASKLVDVGLWHVSSKGLSTGYDVHDYFEYNPTRAQVEETKKARAEAGSRGGKASVRVKKAKNQAKSSKNQAACLDDIQANVKQSSSNIPSPPLPINSSTKNVEESRPTMQVYPIAKAMAEVCKMDLEANKGRLLKEAKILEKANPTPTPDLVKDNYGAGGWWYREDWRGRKSESPNPATIRETWGQWPQNGKPREAQKVIIKLPDGTTSEAMT